MTTKYRIMLSISGFNSTHKDMPNYRKELGSSLGFHIYSKVPGGGKKLASRLNRWSFDFLIIILETIQYYQPFIWYV